MEERQEVTRVLDVVHMEKELEELVQEEDLDLLQQKELQKE